MRPQAHFGGGRKKIATSIASTLQLSFPDEEPLSRRSVTGGA